MGQSKVRFTKKDNPKWIERIVDKLIMEQEYISSIEVEQFQTSGRYVGEREETITIEMETKLLSTTEV